MPGKIDRILDRQGADVVMTTPLIGKRGAVPPAPALIAIYDGKPVSTGRADVAPRRPS